MSNKISQMEIDLDKEDYVAAIEIISNAFGCCADNELGVDEVHHAFLLSILGVIYYQLEDKEKADSFVLGIQKLIWAIHDATLTFETQEEAEEAYIGAINDLFRVDKTIH